MVNKGLVMVKTGLNDGNWLGNGGDELAIVETITWRI